MESNTNPKEALYFTDQDFSVILKSTSSGFDESQEIKSIQNLNEKQITQEQLHHVLYPQDLENRYSQAKFQELKEKAGNSDKQIKMEYNTSRQVQILTIMNVDPEQRRSMMKEAIMKAALEEQNQKENTRQSQLGSKIGKTAEGIQKNVKNAARGLEID
jgi:hypothetical protein